MAAGHSGRGGPIRAGMHPKRQARLEKIRRTAKNLETDLREAIQSSNPESVVRMTDKIIEFAGGPEERTEIKNNEGLKQGLNEVIELLSAIEQEEKANQIQQLIK